MLHTTDERIDLLAEIGIETVQDLLEFYPRTHEDFTVPTNLAELRADEKNLLSGTFTKVWKETVKQRMKLTKALFREQESEAEVECVWFNNPTIAERIPLFQPVLISAKAKLAYGKISLQAPDFEMADAGVHLGRISPVYREHGKLKSSWFRQKIHEFIDQTESLPDILPKDIQTKNDLAPKNTAVHQVHFPDDLESLEKAKKTIAFEELFLLQISALLRKKEWEEKGREGVSSIALDPELIRTFFSALPFTPTDSQKIALFEILKDMEKHVPMLRLLEGDVGSGKTLVALAAGIPVIKKGLQMAFLAPTEILANQHAKGIQKLLAPYDATIKTELLTGGVKGKKREKILEDVRKGKVDVLVGTHALLEESVVFHHLGLVVIDEQHRFGVGQRERLIQKGCPHVLQMTATPIPRTLAIVAFGDQDLSVLTELPPGRKPIHTKVVPPSSRSQVERFIESEVEKGRQGFVICPLVEESEKIEVKAATEEFIRLEKVFPKLRLALLHGRMKSKEKEEIMRDFSAKKYDLLVSTAVVEVGVDVPNATMILIEGAERFGLAQLHQFRGRVGRGEHKSYCFLFPTEHVTDRLKAMEKEDCGFKLAEIDLQMRGPGHIFGVRQSGLPDMKMADISDPRLVVLARQNAEEFLENNSIDDFPEIQEKAENMERVSET
jgi:ATP-dependent DNA helicase RecG